MPIVLISEALLLRTTATDGRNLRDRVLCGFGVRLNSRKRTFLIATSVSGKQFRMMLGRWPLMTVDGARSQAMGAVITKPQYAVAIFSLVARYLGFAPLPLPYLGGPGALLVVNLLMVEGGKQWFYRRHRTA